MERERKQQKVNVSQNERERERLKQADMQEIKKEIVILIMLK